MGRIAELSDLVKRNVEWLDKLVAERGADEILEDYVLMNAVLHMLQTAAQAILDMGYRLLSLLGEKPPSSYSE
ncbi:MAG: HepT-like ribonuclease domain-containing protein, partial [Thermofilaceae archaeon]